VSLALSPSLRAARAGSIITLDLMVVAGAEQVDGVELYLHFDPAVLKVVDAAGSLATSIESDTTALDVPLENLVDNTAGTIRYDAGRLVPDWPTGTFRVATARFKVVGSAATTEVRYVAPSDVFFAGSSMLGTGALGHADLPHAEGVMFMPVIRR